jgi:hypothetical protein
MMSLLFKKSSLVKGDSKLRKMFKKQEFKLCAVKCLNDSGFPVLFFFG